MHKYKTYNFNSLNSDNFNKVIQKSSNIYVLVYFVPQVYKKEPEKDIFLNPKLKVMENVGVLKVRGALLE